MITPTSATPAGDISGDWDKAYAAELKAGKNPPPWVLSCNSLILISLISKIGASKKKYQISGFGASFTTRQEYLSNGHLIYLDRILSLRLTQNLFGLRM